MASGSDFCFPFKSNPNFSWHDGMRQFGWRRSKGRRLHAGCDLIKPVGEQIYAVYDGVLVHEEHYFYDNTYYVTYQHGPYLIRYGEIMRGSSTRKKRGQTIKRGEPVAKVGQLIDKKGRRYGHMLHFEMYANGSDHSTLRSSKNKFQRRADLMNPTKYLDMWVNNLP